MYRVLVCSFVNVCELSIYVTIIKYVLTCLLIYCRPKQGMSGVVNRKSCCGQTRLLRGRERYGHSTRHNDRLRRRWTRNPCFQVTPSWLLYTLCYYIVTFGFYIFSFNTYSVFILAMFIYLHCYINGLYFQCSFIPGICIGHVYIHVTLTGINWAYFKCQQMRFCIGHG